MKTFLHFFTVMIFCMAGCTRQILVPREGRDKIIAEINEHGRRKSGVVLLNEGEKLKSKKLNLKHDSLFLEINNSHEILQVPLENVRQVTVRNSGRGALEGLGLGALAGGSFGIVIGLASGDDPPGWFSMTAGEKATIAGLGLGLLGGLSGLIIGAIIGSPDQYVFSTENFENPGITKVYVMKDARIVEEMDERILISWKGKKAWVSREDCQIDQFGDTIKAYVPFEIYENYFK